MEHLHGWFVAAAYAIALVILVADALLPRIKFQSLLRGTDTLFRLGGDEFTLILENLAGEAQDAERKAQQLLDAMGSPFALSTARVIASPAAAPNAQASPLIMPMRSSEHTKPLTCPFGFCCVLLPPTALSG